MYKRQVQETAQIEMGHGMGGVPIKSVFQHANGFSKVPQVIVRNGQVHASFHPVRLNLKNPPVQLDRLRAGFRIVVQAERGFKPRLGATHGYFTEVGRSFAETK